MCLLCLIYRLSSTYFGERYSGLSGDEIELDEVDATGRLDEDVSDEAVAVDDLRSVVGLVALHQEIGDATAALNITEERLDHRTELRPCEGIVEFE